MSIIEESIDVREMLNRNNERRSCCSFSGVGMWKADWIFHVLQ